MLELVGRITASRVDGGLERIIAKAALTEAAWVTLPKRSDSDRRRY